MATDLRYHIKHPAPEKLSPRALSRMHALVMASVRRDIATRTQGFMMACAVGFNGDKAGYFRKFINRLMRRPVFKLLNQDVEDVTRNVTDFNDAREAAMQMAKELLGKKD